MKARRVDSSDAGTRLDMWLSRHESEHSRARWQELIKAGHVLVDGEARKPHYVLTGSEEVSYDVPPPEPVELVPEDIPLDVLHEDSDIIVINKAPGLVVHPAAGHAQGTLVNALLFHCRDPVTGETSLAGIGGELRPGIVHRLDKDTSGVMVVAKNEKAMRELVKQFKQHEVRKEYMALVWGRPEPSARTIETLVGRSLHNRKKMSARPGQGRPATTHYATVEAFKDVTLLRVRIETGRTHQIRVHLSHVGHPVVGDRQYGRTRKDLLPAPAGRQMLHAEKLAFKHPRTGDPVEFTAPLPDDMEQVLAALRRTSP